MTSEKKSEHDSWLRINSGVLRSIKNIKILWKELYKKEK